MKYLILVAACLALIGFGARAAEVDFTTEEIWHDMGSASADGYEWLYFDLDSPDGNKLTVVFFGPNPGDPRYIRNMYHDYPPFTWGRKSGNTAREYQGVLVQAGLADGTRFESQDFRVGVKNLKFTAAPWTLTVNDSHLEMYMGSNGLPVYHVQFDVRDPKRGTSARGELSFIADVKSFKHKDGYLFYQESGARDGVKKLYHKWVVPVPHAQVIGSYSVTSAQGKTTVVNVDRGTGYHDHNYGTLKIPATHTGWYWGRGQLGDKTAIYAQVWPRKSRSYNVKPYTLMYLASPSGVELDTEEVEFRTVDTREFQRAENGMMYPPGLLIQANDGRRTYKLTVNNDSVINAAVSFYLRHGATGSMSCSDNSCGYERGEFIAEQMDMNRFISWLLKDVVVGK